MLASIPSLRAPQLTGAKLQDVFAPIAGLMMFLQHAAADKAWHLPGHYANLTIDDPWLTEPYGNLSYPGILREMEKHNFHTTIAFVPWNFDRSQPEVVSLFRSHADRFSISIHGNNHNHREFDRYSSQPLADHAANIEQGLARMEAFCRMTSLPYDRVMVFPHAIAPAETLGLLKRYNFLATVNSQSVPLDAPSADGPLIALRPWNLSYEAFPSVRRISAEIAVSRPDIAINAFLGNPQLFYVHQQFFHETIAAFNDIADYVNRLDRGVRWESLGHVSEHLYLLRARDDRDYDVLALSPRIGLANPSDRSVKVHIRRSETEAVSIGSVSVDGKSTNYAITPTGIEFVVTLEPNQIRNIEVEYKNSLSLASIDTSKRLLWINTLRRLSDVRDLWLSRNTVGRKLESAYYYATSQGMAFLLGLASIVLLVISLSAWMWVSRRHKRSAYCSTRLIKAGSQYS